MKTCFLNQLPSDMDTDEIKHLLSLHRNIFGSKVAESELQIEIFERKEAIIHFMHPIRRLRFLLKGRAKILLLHENGKESIIHFVGSNEYIGEFTFLDVEKNQKSVIALRQCIFISIPMIYAKAVLRYDTDFLFHLSRFIGEKMLKRTQVASVNQNYELKNRLAAYILINEYQGNYLEKHTETCEYLGVTYRHLLHVFRWMQDEDYIEKNGKGYKVNHQRLSELAEGITFF